MTRRFIPPILLAVFACALVFVPVWDALSQFEEDRIPEPHIKEKAALEQAVKDKKWDVVKEIIANSPDAVECEFSNERTLLHFAAAAGREDVVKLLLEYGAEVDARDSQRRTPLFDAVEAGSREVIALLVKNGADLNAYDERYRNVLSGVVEKGDIKMVRYLIEQGIDLSRDFCPDEHPLYFAVAHKNMDIVNLLLAGGLDLDSRPGEYALRLAVSQENLEMIKHLLDRGAVINRPGCANERILYYKALETKNVKVIELLLDKGADPNVLTGDNTTALYRAASWGLYEIAELLLKRGAKTDIKCLGSRRIPLSDAVGHKNVKMVKLLLDHGADPCAASYQGCRSSILTKALSHPTTEIASMLVKAGADVNARDRFGSFPLKVAARNKRPDMVKFLLDSGAVVDTPDKTGRNALDEAIRVGDEDSEKLLRAAGAKPSPDPGYSEEEAKAAFDAVEARNYDKIAALLKAKPALLNCRNEKLQNLLHVAVLKRVDAIVELLVDKKIDIGARDEEDRTPLHFAAGCLDTEKILALLLKKGADPNARTYEGRVPLHFAARSKEKVEMLLKAGAKADVADLAMGWTPLHRVGYFEYGSKDLLGIIKILIEHGVDIKARDRFGQTHLDVLLKLPSRPGYMQAIEYYLDAGLSASDALTDAVLRDDATAIAKLLEGDKYPKSYDHCARYYILAACMGRAKATAALLGNGMAFRHWGGDYFYNSPLRHAVSADSVEIVGLFVAYGADPKLAGDLGHTLMFCAESPEMATLLMRFGLSVTAVNAFGETPLHFAVDANNKAMMKFFIEKGSDVKCRDTRGRTLLHWAVTGTDRDWVRFFIKQGLDVNAKDNDGNTPLHTLAEYGGLPMARYLIVKGADVNVSDKYGKTPLYEVARRGDIEMAKLLIANGADVNAKTTHGKTILQAAEEFSRLEMIALLKEHGAE